MKILHSIPITITLVVSLNVLTEPIVVKKHSKSEQTVSYNNGTKTPTILIKENTEITRYNSPVEYNPSKELLAQMDLFNSLTKNWDGHNAIPPSHKVINNTKNIIEYIPSYYKYQLNSDSVVPTPYGTVVIDFYNHSKELVSIEVGETKIGYFTEFITGDNPSSEGESISDNTYSEQIIAALKRLYPNA